MCRSTYQSQHCITNTLVKEWGCTTRDWKINCWIGVVGRGFQIINFTNLDEMINYNNDSSIYWNSNNPYLNCFYKRSLYRQRNTEAYRVLGYGMDNWQNMVRFQSQVKDFCLLQQLYWLWCSSCPPFDKYWVVFCGVRWLGLKLTSHPIYWQG
jgi:hypothetical protein